MLRPSFQLSRSFSHLVLPLSTLPTLNRLPSCLFPPRRNPFFRSPYKMLSTTMPLDSNLANDMSTKKRKTEVVEQHMEMLKVKKLSDKARVPVRGSSKAAGYDLCSAATVTIPARGRAVVPTDLSIAVPPGTYGRVAPRSGLAVKHFIDVGAGVVDEDYRGPLGVVLFNFGEKEFQGLNEGDRIAQLVLEKICTPEIQVVEDLDETARGAGGFGSTGVASK
ncbi:dUTPase-like protein [Paraphysoderma sedebokerense]|nr:dUTPase-like protein [Paraphysoderma sedebokerense]